jgi:hypothetical protein
VLCSGLPVPVWVDHHLEPSDLNQIGCTRSKDTPLVSDQIWALGF